MLTLALVVLSCCGDGGTVPPGPWVPGGGGSSDGGGSCSSCTTATKLAANPTDCSSGQYANAIDDHANLTCSAVATTQLSGTVTNAQLASLYSGVGACGSHLFASTLVSNSSPTCTQPKFTDLSGTPLAGGSVPQVQFNGDGGLAGISNVNSDGTRLSITTETSHPSAPASNALHLDYRPGAGFPAAPETVDSTFGIPIPVGLQTGPALTFLGSKGMWLCQCHVLDAFQSGNYTNVGSGTATSWAVFGNATATNVWDAGSVLSRTRHTTQATAATVNSTAGARYGAETAWLGNTAGAGGFTSVTRIGLTGFTGTRLFCGLWPTLSVVTSNIESSALTNTFYVGADGPDTNLHACSNDTSGSATCTDLGSSFPKTNGFYEVRLAAMPNSGGLAYSVERLDSAATAVGTLGSDFPGSNVPLSWQCTINNTDAGQAAKMDFGNECQCANW